MAEPDDLIDEQDAERSASDFADVHAAIKHACDNNPQSLDRQKACALRAVLALPDVDSFRDQLLRIAIHRLVWLYRGQQNAHNKKQGEPKAGEATRQGAPLKTINTRSHTAEKLVLERYYGNVQLKDLKVGDLPDLAAKHEALSGGYRANAALFRALHAIALSKKARPDAPVGKAVTEAEARREDRRTQRECKARASA